MISARSPPPKYFRLAPGREVRLRYGYIIKCEDFVKNPQTGEIDEIHCTYDPQTRGGYAPDGRKVQGTIHWVSAQHALDAEVRMYDRLFTVPNPGRPEEGKTFLDYLNPEFAEGPDRLQGRAQPGRRRPGCAVTSSSAKAFSASISIPNPAPWSST